MEMHPWTLATVPLTSKGTATQLPSHTILSRRRDETTQGLVRSEVDSDVRRHAHRGWHQATVQRSEATLLSHDLQSHAPHGKLGG